MPAAQPTLAPLVAIVTPVYNGGEFLADCMDSVQAQSYPNIEHVVVDNASTDDTPRVLERYTHARFPVVVRRNAETISIGKNWNLAIEAVPAKAKYFRVLSADDFMHSDFVARTVAVAERNPSVAIVGCRLDHRGEESDEWGWEPHTEVFAGREAIRRMFLNTGKIIAHQTLIRRSEIEGRRPFFDPEMATNDTDACLDILTRNDWGFVHEMLATTRDHPNTYTNVKVRSSQINKCEQLLLLERYAEFAFGRDDALTLTRDYRRHYLRQLMVWIASCRYQLVGQHLSMLRRSKTGLSWLAWIDAIAAWPMSRLKAGRRLGDS